MRDSQIRLETRRTSAPGGRANSKGGEENQGQKHCTSTQTSGSQAEDDSDHVMLNGILRLVLSTKCVSIDKLFYSSTVFSQHDTPSPRKQSNNAHARSKIQQKRDHDDGPRERDAFRGGSSSENLIEVARRLWDQNSLAIRCSLQALSLRPELFDIDRGHERGCAGWVKLRRLTFLSPKVVGFPPFELLLSRWTPT